MCIEEDPSSGDGASLQSQRNQEKIVFHDEGISPKLQEALQSVHVHELAKCVLKRTRGLVMS